MVLEGKSRLSGAVSPDLDKRRKSRNEQEIQETVHKIKNVESQKQNNSRAALRRKAKKIQREQEELLQKLSGNKLEYKDPILFGGSTVPKEVQRMNTLSSHLLTTQHPETETYPSILPTARNVEPGDSLFAQPMTMQYSHDNPQAEEPIEIGVEKLPEWDKNVNIIEEPVSPAQSDKEAPVLFGLEKIESEGGLAVPKHHQTLSTVTEFDENELPDESSLSEKRQSQEYVEPIMQPVEQEVTPAATLPEFEPVLRQNDASTMTRSSFVPKSMIQQTHLNKNIIPLDTPCYLTHVGTDLNIEKDEKDEIYLEKKTKKASKFFGLINRKMNKQLFIFRDNGHIESAMNADLVLSTRTSDFTTGGAAQVFVCKKKALMEQRDESINQRWIVQESFSDRRYRYITSASDTRMVLDKEADGFRLVLRPKDETLNQQWAFKTYQSI
jgi:hypothetical protein